MSAVLAGPLLAAAALLCVSGVAKLRTPGPAVEALASLHLRVGHPAIRLLAGAECALGLTALLAPGRGVSAALAVAYLAFAAVTLALRRARAACGCFGEGGAPASASGAALSAGLAATCAVTALAGPHGLGWALAQPAAGPMLLGTGGCVFALVVLYTEMPAAWAAWGGR